MHAAVALYSLAVQSSQEDMETLLKAADEASLTQRLLDAVASWSPKEDPKRRRCHTNQDESPRPTHLPDRGVRYALVEMLRCLAYFGTKERVLTPLKQAAGHSEDLSAIDCDEWRDV